MEEGLRFGVFGPLRLFHDFAEASQQGRGSVRVTELVLDHREEGHVTGWFGIKMPFFPSFLGEQILSPGTYAFNVRDDDVTMLIGFRSSLVSGSCRHAQRFDFDRC